MLKLSKKDLNELKGYPNPPAHIKVVCESTLFLLDVTKTDWPTMVRELGRSNFIDKLL